MPYLVREDSLSVYKDQGDLNKHTRSLLPKLDTPLKMKFLMCLVLVAVALSAASGSYIRSGWNGGWGSGWGGYSSPIVYSSGYGGLYGGYGGYGSGYGGYGRSYGGWW